ncbi:SAF domain-containing protein [Jongsikchunia kroppenstedtii]|uniref:SAF domain-containing protein n=1 Tax=Jongsikchunia kroppenstedtii TaxID=1121721 RepID=UPI00036E02C3|nr:SAF domain-containing protein [Jongsikchunia kroppenstedtii]
MRLEPTLLDRLRGSSRPAWARSLLIRRVAAAVLAAIGVTSAVVAGREPTQQLVYVAAHDLTPGTTLAATDLTTRQIASDSLPAGTASHIDEISGHTVTGPIRAGEILTATRLLNSRLPQSLLHRDDARLVPVEPAGSAVIGLLRVGDVVDVLSENRSDTADLRDDPRATAVLARSAVVALISTAAGQNRGDGGRVLLLAMPEHDAHIVAGTTLTAPITLVFH